jgi:hypothetical protein
MGKKNEMQKQMSYQIATSLFIAWTQIVLIEKKRLCVISCNIRGR